MDETLVFSMDVEDWFHSENVKALGANNLQTGHSSLSHLERIVHYLNKRGAKGTFFFLGEVAQKIPNLVREISDTGHEICVHGWSHKLLSEMSYDETKEDIHKTTLLIEDIIGKKVYGYRSPCFSQNDYIFDILYDHGYKYTSMSIKSSGHDRYSSNEIAESRLIDFPLPVASFFGFNIPATGGGWFRLFPTTIQNFLIKKSPYNPKIFYCHPWDFDEEKPSFSSNFFNIYNFRNSVGTSKSFNKLDNFKFSNNTLKDYL